MPAQQTALYMAARQPDIEMFASNSHYTINSTVNKTKLDE